MRRKLGLILAAGFALAACGGEASLSADAGLDFSVAVGEMPVFDGCGSEGNITNFEWIIVEAPETAPADSPKEIREFEENCEFTLEAAMILEDVGLWTIELTVTDGTAEQTDQVMVEVTES